MFSESFGNNFRQVAPVVAATWKAFTDFPSQRAVPWGVGVATTKKLCHQEREISYKQKNWGKPWWIFLVCSELGIWLRFFPKCAARIPVSLWGSGGWVCVRSTLRLCSQQGHMAVPLVVSSAKGVTFGGFTCGVAFRFAWQVWHFFVTFRRFQTCFVTCRKPILCGQAQYFYDVFVRWVAVFVAGAALWMCPSSFCVASAAL